MNLVLLIGSSYTSFGLHTQVKIQALSELIDSLKEKINEQSCRLDPLNLTKLPALSKAAYMGSPFFLGFFLFISQTNIIVNAARLSYIITISEHNKLIKSTKVDEKPTGIDILITAIRSSYVTFSAMLSILTDSKGGGRQYHDECSTTLNTRAFQWKG